MELLSSAFDPGGRIPPIHTADGDNISPPLHWQAAPAATLTYALILDDPDAPPGLWIHWVLFDIPASRSSLPRGLERADQLADGARHGSCWGVDSFSRRGYHGPQPPPGSPHRYRFQPDYADSSVGFRVVCLPQDPSLNP